MSIATILRHSNATKAAANPPVTEDTRLAPVAINEAKIKLQFITEKFTAKYFGPNTSEVNAEHIVGQVP